MDLGAGQTVVATISVVGFIIFFGSPTAIVLSLDRVDQRLQTALVAGDDATILAARADILAGEDTLARFFVEAFRDKAVINSIYTLSMVYGAAMVADMASVALEATSAQIAGVSWSVVAFSLSWTILIVAVLATLYGIYRVRTGADKRLDQEKNEVLTRVAHLRAPAHPEHDAPPSTEPK